MKAPNNSMKMPDQRLMLCPRDCSYISVFPLVSNPCMVRMMPRVLNINPMGIFISKPIVVVFFVYQKIMLRTTAMAPTIMAMKPGV